MALAAIAPVTVMTLPARLAGDDFSELSRVSGMHEGPLLNW
jgi:hypothetical protein